MKYFVIDRRGFVGNDVLFWAQDSKGYTTDIEKAHAFDEDEARKIDAGRSTDCAIPVHEVVEVSRRVVDFQNLDRKWFDSSFSYFDSNGEPTESDKIIESLKCEIARLKRAVEDYPQVAGDYGVHVWADQMNKDFGMEIEL